ncbi:hypothetical protein BT69DRAFT_1285591 [Atractiella rhizophila]|nr:hypothetical protein BT69DRAFT_1285591 [Atractiella rhizophila]
MSKPWHVGYQQQQGQAKQKPTPSISIPQAPAQGPTSGRMSEEIYYNSPLSASYEPPKQISSNYLRPYATDEYPTFMDRPPSPLRPSSFELPRPAKQYSRPAAGSQSFDISGAQGGGTGFPFAGVISPVWNYPEPVKPERPPMTYDDEEPSTPPTPIASHPHRPHVPHQAPPSTSSSQLAPPSPSTSQPTGGATGLKHRMSTRPPKPSSKDPFFYKYSACSGRRRALLIGINYTGVIKEELKGCHNDVHNMKKFLIDRYNYKAKDIVTLLDHPKRGKREVPTRKNIIDAMKWLVQDARVNDSLFMHFSGHGGQTEDLDGDEDDGFDEVIYPVDFQKSGHIVDDEMHDILVKNLPAGCRLTVIFDCCNSGTALDLPYIYSTEGKVKEPNILTDIGNGVFGAVGAYVRKDINGVIKAFRATGNKVVNGAKVTEEGRKVKTSAADVISWSGCKDSQQSADTEQSGLATGAMSWAFIKSLNQEPKQSYLQLLNSIRKELKGRYAQKPQLSSSHPLDCDLMFVM